MSKDQDDNGGTNIHIEGLELGDVSGQIAIGGNVSQNQGGAARQAGGDNLPDPVARPEQRRLRDILRDSFSEGELQDLCFDLGLDYDVLPGEGRADKAREIVLYFRRRQRIEQLVDHIRALRPEIEL